MKRYTKGKLNNRTSIITINKNTVTKEVIYKDRISELIERELFWLKKLEYTGFVPKVISSTQSSITTEYIGPPISKKNMPKDAEKQLLNIALELNKNFCFYNDWKPANVLVKDDKLYLIDFGWCPALKTDFTCEGNVKSDLLFKPSGDRIFNVCEIVRSK